MAQEFNILSPGGSAASQLCLACGLCCCGAIFDKVKVKPKDIRTVIAMGLAVEKFKDGSIGFRQPCALYRNERCSAYPQHPPTCQRYRCALLRKYERAETTFDDCLKIIGQVKELLTARGKSPPEDFSLGVRIGRLEKMSGANALQGSGTQSRANAAFALRTAALDVLIQKHFRLPKK